MQVLATQKRKRGRPWKRPNPTVSPASVVSVKLPTPIAPFPPAVAASKKTFDHIRSTSHNIARQKQVSSVLEHRKLLQQNKRPSRPASEASSIYASCDSLSSLDTPDNREIALNNSDIQSLQDQSTVNRSFAGPKSKKAEHYLKVGMQFRVE
jgi:hypothetical protein